MQYLSTEVEGGACPLPDHMCIYYQLLLFIIIINNNTLHASLDSSDLCVRRRCRSAHDLVQWSHCVQVAWVAWEIGRVVLVAFVLQLEGCARMFDVSL